MARTSGKPLRRGERSRETQQSNAASVAPNIWEEKTFIGSVLRYCGIEGGVTASQMKVNSAMASRGGVWVEVDHPSFPGPQPVWVENTISEIMSCTGGNLVGKRVKVTMRGLSAQDIQNGSAKFIGSDSERYPHPDQQSSPVSVGAFQGASCTPESYAVFASSEYKGESQ